MQIQLIFIILFFLLATDEFLEVGIQTFAYPAQPTCTELVLQRRK